MTKYVSHRSIKIHPRTGPTRSLSVRTSMLVWILIVTFYTLAVYPPDVRAMLAPTEVGATGVGSRLQRLEDVQTIQRFLEAKIVQQRLSDFGLTAEEISSRLGQLSDDQVHDVATQIDSLIPGSGALEIIVILLVIAILVVILIYLLNHKIVVQEQ